MRKEIIEPLDYASVILTALPKGVLLTTQAQGNVNVMTIGWGALGIDWREPVFIAFVRTGRLTHSYLGLNPQFTVNVPVGAYDAEIIRVAGTRSGRDMDKASHLGLHLEEPLKIDVPGIRELPLTLECEVIYRQLQDVESLPGSVRDKFYPRQTASDAHGVNQDPHTAFYGKIVSSYIIKAGD